MAKRARTRRALKGRGVATTTRRMRRRDVKKQPNRTMVYMGGRDAAMWGGFQTRALDTAFDEAAFA